MSEKVNAEIYRLSELPSLADRIIDMRDGGQARREYEKALAEYHTERGNRPEVKGFAKTTVGIGVGGYESKGYYTLDNGQPVFHPQPWPPRMRLWVYFPYSRSEHYIRHARDGGLLEGGGKYNRPVNPKRVQEYQEAMVAGEWEDLLSDPIAITAEGEVINGQHRLAAAANADRKKAGNDPRFLVLFDVDPKEIHFADRSKRTGHDMEVIARKAAS